jgi:hypothetical protein
MSVEHGWNGDPGMGECDGVFEVGAMEYMGRVPWQPKGRLEESTVATKGSVGRSALGHRGVHGESTVATKGSVGRSALGHRQTSGAIQNGVPIRLFATSSWFFSRAETPKSISFARRSLREREGKGI